LKTESKWSEADSLASSGAEASAIRSAIRG
jgi:hypothetical protein